MIVFLDITKNIAKVYSPKGEHIVDFYDIEKIKQITGNQNILYVTNAINAKAEDVVKVVRSLPGPFPKPKHRKTTDTAPAPAEEQGDRMVLRAKKNGSFAIKDLKLPFRDPFDFYSVERLKSQYGEDVFEKSTDLLRFMSLGYLEIVPLSVAKKKAQEWDIMRKKMEDKGSIIIADRNAVDTDGDATKDAIEVDIMGRGGGGGLPNEGALLPD
jgi:hypothetical protein